jgi:hypothetical protein
MALPEGFEKRYCLEVGEDIKEAQEFAMDAAGCRQENRKECFVATRGPRVFTTLLHFGTSSAIQELVRIIVS